MCDDPWIRSASNLVRSGTKTPEYFAVSMLSKAVVCVTEWMTGNKTRARPNTRPSAF
jgi:hypothetical protein